MNSEKHEEVRKRRAKAATTRFNLYQKMVLAAGGLTLFSLAVGISPRLGPFLVAGVVGGMVVLFLVVKTFRGRRKEETKEVQQEAFYAREESIVPQPIPDLPDSNPGPLNSEGLHENKPLEAEEAVGEEDLNDLQEVAREGGLAQILERLASAEEKVSRLKERVMELEEKVAGYEEGQLKSESKIDLQTILAHLDEKQGKVL